VREKSIGFKRPKTDTNLKLGDVVSDVMGKASSMILHAIAEGETDPVRLASFAVGRVRASKEELEAALTGKITEHHRFMLKAHLKQISCLNTAIEQVNAEIARRFHPPEPPPEEQQGHVEPAEREEDGNNEPERPACAPAAAVEGQSPLSWQEAVRLVDQITGISEQVAWGVLAEIGIEMSQFPSEKHLASWVGLCPGNHESAGKRYSGKTRKGNPHARRLLIQAALAAAKSKKSYLSVQYRRIAARRGKKKAAVAVAHSILVIIYHVLRDRSTYQDLGSTYFDERDRQAVQKQLVRRLERLGYQVDLQPVA
jgi:transposase